MYLMTCEVSVNITWYGSEIRRYETDKDPDVDNIIKPTIDGLTGPDGVLIDDCQVQYVSCSWIDTNGSDVVDIEIRYHHAKYVNKKNLVFVQVDGALCVPVDCSIDISRRKIVEYVEIMQSRWSAAREFEKQEKYEEAADIKPYMMHFHKTRVSNFPVLMAAEINDYLKSLEKGQCKI